MKIIIKIYLLDVVSLFLRLIRFSFQCFQLMHWSSLGLKLAHYKMARLLNHRHFAKMMIKELQFFFADKLRLQQNFHLRNRKLLLMAPLKKCLRSNGWYLRLDTQSFVSNQNDHRYFLEVKK